MPACPSCASNEQCAITTQTCHECPETYCARIESTSNGLSSAQVGGIAGGLSGFFFILIVIGGYFLYRKYKHLFALDYDATLGEEMKGLADNEYDEEIGKKRMSQATFSTMTNSVFTKASNVINIAYIPGVTSRQPRAAKRSSIYSKAGSTFSTNTSFFGDLENASIHNDGSQIAAKATNPLLVEVGDDYDFDDLNEDGKKVPLKKPLAAMRMQSDIIEEEEEEEEKEGEDAATDTNGEKKPHLLPRYGALVNKFTNINDAGSSEESESDSDEENIEFIRRQQEEGNLNLDDLNAEDSFYMSYKSSNGNSTVTIPIMTLQQHSSSMPSTMKIEEEEDFPQGSAAADAASENLFLSIKLDDVNKPTENPFSSPFD